MHSEDTAYRAIAIVGAGAILPDAANVAAFWENVKTGRYSITEVTPDRWDPAFYYDPDHSAPDKTYSKIGGWVREQVWDPLKWHLAIPPRVTDAMDQAQKWAIAASREALLDYGYPNRPLDADRVAVILGNAMAGEKHYLTALRVNFPEYAHELAESASFASLPQAVRSDITRELHDRIGKRLPEVTEDSMPGELANCIAGRIANIYNFHGPNFICDAACASAMAAISAAVEGLVANDFDAVITGGIDRNMGAQTFVKFCKIGALSATGTRPYAEGADGFVMGEGSAIFVMKRLADAERDGDKIYAVLRGFGASSDGKGKGITAPNPVGQKFCLERAWKNAGLPPSTATLIEGHGTSTRVGDVVEAQCMADLLSGQHLPTHSVALGSVKSNIGHLKGAAGAAGLLKTALALRDKVLPPSVHCEHPSPDIDFAHSPLYVNTELKPWTVPSDTPRRAGVSAFGFGGTNFHLVLEEHIPHRLTGNGKRSVAVGTLPQSAINEVVMNAKSVSSPAVSSVSPSACKPPLRGALLIGAASEAALADRLRSVLKDAQAGFAPAPAVPAEADLRAPQRLAIDYVDAADLADKSAKALKALAANQQAVWKALRAQGIFRGQGPAPKVAFLYTGQGSQYVNMLRPLYTTEPIVTATFAEADRVMTPLLGKPLTDFVFVDQSDPVAVAKADDDLRQTAITQPAVLAIDLALTRLLAAYGITPDMTMGHSLGEYGALVASGALPFEDASGSRQCPWPRHDPRGRRRHRQDGRRVCAAERNRTNPQNGRRLRRHRQHQQRTSGRHRRCNQCGHSSDGSSPKSWLRSLGIARQPCFPHFDCCARQRTVAERTRAPSRGIAASAHRRQRHRRVLSLWPWRRAADIGPARQASCFASAIRQRSAHAIRSRSTHLRRSWPEKSSARIRRRCPRQPWRCGFPLHQSSEVRRHRIV